MVRHLTRQQAGYDTPPETDERDPALQIAEAVADVPASRLTRLAACYRARLSTVDDEALDAVPDGNGWSLRQMLHHVSRVGVYADMLG